MAIKYEFLIKGGTVMYCLDGERGAELRPRIRENQLAHGRGSGIVRIAGPAAA